MRNDSPTARLIDLAAEITACGPRALAYDGLRLLQHADRLEQVLRGEGENVVPVTIDFWPSLSCNARCPTCPYRLSGARDKADETATLALVDTVHAREILTGARIAGVRSVIFTGGGDPLLHPSIGQIARMARASGLQWALFTNGLLLDAATAATLIAAGPTFLRVSLDAGTAPQHAKTYGLPERAFDQVIANILAAAKVARVTGKPLFGLSFTLSPTTAENELESIRVLISQLRREVGHGLGLIAFRPRLVHYLNGTVCVPQPHRSCFEPLAEAIRQIIIEPLVSDPNNPVRLDLKVGLFKQAAVAHGAPGCVSTGWHTTIDHEGVGYATAELAGVRDTGQCWGCISRARSFKTKWFGSPRLRLYRDFSSGRVNVPVVHRTSPIDAFLRTLAEAVCHRFDPKEARDAAEAVARASWYHTPNPDFV